MSYTLSPIPVKIHSVNLFTVKRLFTKIVRKYTHKIKFFIVKSLLIDWTLNSVPTLHPVVVTPNTGRVLRGVQVRTATVGSSRGRSPQNKEGKFRKESFVDQINNWCYEEVPERKSKRWRFSIQYYIGNYVSYTNLILTIIVLFMNT